MIETTMTAITLESKPFATIWALNGFFIFWLEISSAHVPPPI
jgi:hypothetical protein